MGITPHQSLNDHTFIYDINIDVTITTNQQKSQLRRDCVRTVLLVILSQVFHENEGWRKIGVYLVKKLEEELEENGSWTTERKNHHVYRGELQISGHCAKLNVLPEDLPVVYVDVDADFSMVNGKLKGNRRVEYQGMVFLSPTVNSAQEFYEDHGFDHQESDCMRDSEGRETRKYLKMYLKKIMKDQRRCEGIRLGYDCQLAWKTVFEGLKEIREDPNYEVFGDESPVYNRRYGRFWSFDY